MQPTHKLPELGAKHDANSNASRSSVRALFFSVVTTTSVAQAFNRKKRYL
jgi:hypothetical protein